jgi:hypothetical protein
VKRQSCFWEKEDEERLQYDILTYGGYKCKVLQHHMQIQVTLSCTKELPFLLGKGNAHILKGCTALTWLGQNIYNQLLS